MESFVNTGMFPKRLKRFYWSVNRKTKGVLVYALLTSMAIIIGVLTIVFTSSKLDRTCEFTFKRINKNSVSLSSQPRSVAVGDFNNDDRIDIVVANSGTNTIGIFLANLNQNFSNQITYSTGSQSQPYSIVVDHFNNDTYMDIAVANYGGNNIGIFLGHGNGTFNNQEIFSIGSSRPFFITSGNLNNDNRKDIVTANYGNDSIGILFGYGNGSFQSPTTFFTGYDSLPYSLAVGNLNKDNLSDIIIVNNGINNIGILLGNGNSTFARQKTYSTGRYSNPSSVAVGDLNHDNELDIVVANYGTSNVGILIGYGNGTFAAQKTYPIVANARPNYVTVGDFNKDNQLDVVIVDSKNNQIHILPGYGNGTFATITTYNTISGSHPFSAAVADFNNDNRSDIVVANYATNNIRILTEYSSKPSAKFRGYPLGRKDNPSSVALSDFNNDNYTDIVVNGYAGGILVLMGDDNGNFEKRKAYSTGNQSASQYISVGDLNNDNRMDIVSANLVSDNVGVLLGQDNGTFSNVTTYFTGVGSSPWCVILEDVNNDKRLDIVTVNSNNGSILILIGDGNGAFANAATYSTDIIDMAKTVAVGDINNDYQLDIVVGYFYRGWIGVLFGYGNGTFRTAMSFMVDNGASLISIALADLNNDNQLDIVSTDIFTNNVAVLLGHGNGTFGMTRLYSTGDGSKPYCSIVIDFNNDNYYDIAVTALGNNQIVIFFGHGNGSFELPRTFSTGSGSSPYGIAFGNLKNNNPSQLVVTYSGTGSVGVLTEYYYTALFDNRITYSTGSVPHSYSVAIGDFNNDHQFDIVVANSGTDNIGLLFNLGNNIFETQMIYSMDVDSYPQYVITDDINQDNHSDIITVNSLNDTISVFIGYGNGTFAAQKMYSTGSGSHPSSIALGDFNNDNRSDLIITNKDTDSIGLFLGFDYASLRRENTYTSIDSVGPWWMVVSDFNHDNYLDIVAVFMTSNNIGIRLGYSNGSFGTMLTYTTGVDSNPNGINVGDFDNDGHSDIVISNTKTNNVAIFLGYGNGSFAIMIITLIENGSKPYGLDVGDFNHDSYLDIAVANSGLDNVGILLGYGNGSFAAMVTCLTGPRSEPYTVVVHDLNNDDRQDIVTVNHGTNSICVFLGYGNGSFSIHVTYTTRYTSLPYWASLGDFNGDNRLDIVTANSNSDNVGIYLGYGNGSFAAVKTYSTGFGSSPVYTNVGDFNNDNRLDIAVANFYTDTVLILFGFGDGSFLLGTPYSTGIGSGPAALGIGDFNHDNRLDIAVVNYVLHDIRIFLGNGSEPFADVTTYNITDGSQPHSVAIGDFNNDGRSDLVVANYGNNNVGVLLGYGNGAFDTMTIYSTGNGSAPYSVAVGDFNSDNQSDIVVTNSESDNVAIFFGFGNGTFGLAATYPTGNSSRPYTVTIGDLNNDNISDIAVVNSGTSNILLLYDYRNGTFGNTTSYALGYGYLPYGIAVRDLNQDNWMDIVIACYGTDHVEILIRMCT